MIRIFASRLAPAIPEEHMPHVYSLAASYARQRFRAGTLSVQSGDSRCQAAGKQPREYCRIAHDGEWLVCIIGSVPVGIGIKRVGNLEETNIACFLSEQERCRLFSRCESINEKLMYIFNLWTLKASYLQALGTGQLPELPEFSLAVHDELCQWPEQPVQMGHSAMYFRRYGLDPRYKLSVCAAENSFPANILVNESFCLHRTVVATS